MGMLSGPQTEKKIIQLIKSCKSFSIAVAWATSNKVFKAIQKHQNKLEMMIVGIDFWQTHPVVLTWMQNSGKSNMYIGQCQGGIFHPKVFYFEFDNQKEHNTLIIGSANLTSAAFSRNEEACVGVKIDKSDDSGLSMLAKWRKNGIPIVDYDIDEYRKNYLTKGRVVRKSLSIIGCEEFRDYPDLLSLTFDDYYWLCTQDPYHYFNMRLDLLDFGQTSPLSQGQFQCIAGIGNAPTPNHQLGWGLFGSMQAEASFRSTVLKNWKPLHDFYQKLPSQGYIGRQTAKQFIDVVENHININFGNQYNKKNHLSAASRLLAMKRPDLFFCVNGANCSRLANDLGMTVAGKRGIKTIDGYLDAVEILQQSTWGSTSLPTAGTKNEIRCWEGRIAMIDALYYEPI